MSTRRVYLSAAFLFLSGAIFGAVCAHTVRGPWHHPHEGLTSKIMDHLQRKLDLSPQQVSELTPIVTDLKHELDAMRRENRPRLEAAMDTAVQKALPLLNPEQQSRLHELQQKVIDHLDHTKGH